MPFFWLSWRYSPREVVERLDNLSRHITHWRIKVTQQLDALAAQVAANTTVVQSAIVLINGLKTSLDAAIAAQADGDNGAALQALSDQLAATDSALANAVAANTPAAPAPAPSPEPAPAPVGDVPGESGSPL